MSAPQRLNVAPNPSNAVVPGGQEVPTGMISLFAGSTAPDDWLICNGAAVSRIDYDDLFSVIGTTYGAGDGAPVSFNSTTAVISTPTILTITMTSGVVAPSSAFGVGKTFTMTGGPAGYSSYAFTVVARGSFGEYVDATAVFLGSPVIFSLGTNNTPGTIIPNSPTTFNTPNTSGRTVRGVGTAGITAVTLAQASGADATSVTLSAANLPPHRHGISTPGPINIVSSGGTPVLGNTWNSTVQYTNANATYLENGSTLVSNSAFSVATTNQYLGLNYIIKT